MKRFVLAACLIAGAAGNSRANSVTVNNHTGCTFTLDFSFTQYATAPPGTTYIDPLWQEDDFIACKVTYDYYSPNRIVLIVGISPNYNTYATSATNMNNPPCVNGNFYSAIWTQSSPTANATLIIF
ncbi:hypothetical protein [Taibaiella chishuiensis]|uniref:Secreted protein n=1 Tax=Taibaiella chishuiensis TaxID=1434707 RepID=A0A2P8DDC6_9BACT|nr:hypothetical protein [Taibaiella chishuiensis]PSK95220.1 hypothetical protein B0I18_1011386 [Taibaiella chishuiensis]